MYDIAAKITAINNDLNTIEINGVKSKFIYENIRYTEKITKSVSMVFFPKGLILKVN